MKYLSVVLIVACFILSNSCLQAQESLDSIKLIHTLWKVEQTKTILSQMHLKESEKSAFWSVYNAYRRATEIFDLEYLQIMNLSQKHPNDPDGKETEMLFAALLDNDYALAKVRKHYFKIFCKALPPAKASEFMMIDNSLRSLFRLNLEKDTPLKAVSETTVYSASQQQIQR
jgi:hypothetical protein